MNSTLRRAMISAFSETASIIEKNGIPQEIFALTLETNYWFTASYIRNAFSNIFSWLNTRQLSLFLENYQFPEEGKMMNVGLILAGNLPLVGFHDVLMTMLSGNRAMIKCSHKDPHLVPFFLGLMSQVWNPAENFFSLTWDQKPDFLIATGSDTTARQLDYDFRNVPRILRGNRTSAAVLSGNESASDLKNLAEDILMYNNMGCRSVSNLLVPEGWQADALVGALTNFHEENLPYAWFEHIAYLAARESMLSEQVIQGSDSKLKRIETRIAERRAILSQHPHMRVAEPGLITVVEYSTGEGPAAKLQGWQHKLQQVYEPPFGKAQSPDVGDFADGVDTMAALTTQAESNGR